MGTHNYWRSIAVYCISILALIAQASAFVLWPAINDSLEVQILAIPLILISFRWWENYINSYSSVGLYDKTTLNIKKYILLYMSMNVCVFVYTRSLMHALPYFHTNYPYGYLHKQIDKTCFHFENSQKY